MSTVAEQLRAAREAAGLSVTAVAEATKIRTDHIRALDDGNFDVFTAPVYIRGFVRSYAQLLRLDVPAVMARLDVELAATEKFAEPPALSRQPKTLVDWITLQFSRVDWRIAVGVAVVLLLGFTGVAVHALWRHYHDRDPLAEVRPAVYSGTQQMSGDTLPLPPR